MGNDRRQRVVLALIGATFALFLLQLVNIQLLGNTKPVSLAHSGTPVAPPGKQAPDIGMRFSNWWHRNVESRARRAWKKIGAA